MGWAMTGLKKSSTGGMTTKLQGALYSQFDLNTSGTPVQEVERDPAVLAFAAEEGWFDHHQHLVRGASNYNLASPGVHKRAGGPCCLTGGVPVHNNDDAAAMSAGAG